MAARRASGVVLLSLGVLLALACAALLLRPEIELGHVLATMGLGFAGLLVGAGLWLAGQRVAGAMVLGAHVTSALLGWGRHLWLGDGSLAALPVLLATGPALVVMDAPVLAAVGIVGGASVGFIVARRRRGPAL